MIIANFHICLLFLPLLASNSSFQFLHFLTNHRHFLGPIPVPYSPLLPHSQFLLHSPPLHFRSPPADPHSNVPPKITDRKPFIVVDKGDQVMLPCANQGSPEPQTVWYQILNTTNSLPSSAGLSASLPASLSANGLSTGRSGSNFQNSFQDRIRVGNDHSNDRIYQWNTNLVIREAGLEHSKLFGI